MTHILVKWLHADAWDVYPIRNLVDVEAGRKLTENPAYIDSMAGRVFKVSYGPSPEDSHDAFILAVDAAKMVKRLKKIIETMEETTTRNVEPAAEVDIGNGVTVPKAMLDEWRTMCPTPPRFSRALLRTVFTADKLEGCSLFGQPGNLRPGCLPKPALDKRRVDAVISYTCSIFNATDTKVKASLATMLSKGK